MKFLKFWRKIHITQSCLPTTIYVQNLSFHVTQISDCHNFFSIWPIYMIFMGDREEVWNFLTPSKKRVKRVKKGQNLKFSKKSPFFPFFHFFLKVHPIFTLFTLFVLFSHKYDRFINPGHFMLKRVSECTIPFF